MLSAAWLPGRRLPYPRPAHQHPCDDSVVRGHGETELPVRRSRGYAPVPVNLPVEVVPTLAAGGELKNTFCLAAGRTPGSASTSGTWAAWKPWPPSPGRWTASSACTRLPLSAGLPTAIPATSPGAARGRLCRGPVVEVQHHHAHMRRPWSSTGWTGHPRCSGFAFDGTGYGRDDGGPQIWGGEVLVADYDGFQRVWHLRPCLCPGGTPPSTTLAVPQWRTWRPCGSSRPQRALGGGLQRCRAPGGPPAGGKQRRLRTHDQHGPALRRGGVPIGVAPSGHLRGPGSHGARGSRCRGRVEPAAGSFGFWCGRQRASLTWPRYYGASSTGWPWGPPSPSWPPRLPCRRRRHGLPRRRQGAGPAGTYARSAYRRRVPEWSLAELAGARSDRTGTEVLTHRLVPPNDGGNRSARPSWPVTEGVDHVPWGPREDAGHKVGAGNADGDRRLRRRGQDVCLAYVPEVGAG